VCAEVLSWEWMVFSFFWPSNKIYLLCCNYYQYKINILWFIWFLFEKCWIRFFIYIKKFMQIWITCLKYDNKRFNFGVYNYFTKHTRQIIKKTFFACLTALPLHVAHQYCCLKTRLWLGNILGLPFAHFQPTHHSCFLFFVHQPCDILRWWWLDWH